MKQLTLSNTKTLLVQPGNRNFCAIYNNGPNIAYLVFDGDDGVNNVNPSAVLTTGFVNGGNVTGLVIPLAAYQSAAGLIAPGQLVTGTGIPDDVYVTAVLAPNMAGGTNVTLSVTPFTATSNADANPYTFMQTSTSFDTANGFPLPVNTWMNFDNSGFRNIQNNAIYGVSAGTSDLRIQGA